MARLSISVERNGDTVTIVAAATGGQPMTMQVDCHGAIALAAELLRAASTPDHEAPASFFHEDPMFELQNPGVQIGSLGEAILIGLRPNGLPPIFVSLEDSQASHLRDALNDLLRTPRDMRSQPTRN